MEENNYLTQATRAIVIHFTIYNAKFDYWASVLFLVENSVSGYLFASRLEVYCFRMDEFTIDDKGMQANNILRIIILVYLLLFMTIAKLCAYERLEHVLKIKSLFFLGLEVLIIILQVIAFALPIQESKKLGITADMIDDPVVQESYHYTFNAAYWYEQAYILNSLSLLLILYKMIQTFRNFRIVHIVMFTLESACFQVGVYLVFIMLLLITLTVVAMNIWGSYIRHYKDFTNAFMGVVFLQMGHTQFELLSDHNFIWAFIFIASYFLLVLYILLSAFMVVYIDSFRRTCIMEGAIDQDVPGEINNWREFVKWILDSLPCLDRVSKNLVKGKENDGEGEEEGDNESDEEESDEDGREENKE